MDTVTFLVLCVIFGAIGMAYFIYGKRQAKFIPMIAGIGLCAFPYFVSNPYLFLAIGIALIILPFLIRG